MPNLTTVLGFALPLAILSWMALRDHRASLAKRRVLLDDCAALFDSYAVTHDADGFPRLSGRCGKHDVDVRLISDTMTMRRLPQLWLQVTCLARVPANSGFAVLVRPTGCDFYSLTGSFEYPIETPPDFPSEVLIRGKDGYSRYLFEKLTPMMSRILADPRVKEIAVTPAGMRIIRQASEGRRGEYLLLRQATFDDAAVSRETLKSVLAEIETLYDASASDLAKVSA